MSIESLFWKPDQLDYALAQLAYRSGFVKRHSQHLPKPPANCGNLSMEQIGRWLDLAATHLQIEVEPSQCTYLDLEELLTHGGPMLLSLSDQRAPTALHILAVKRRSRRWIEILAPDLSLHRLPTEQVASAMCATLETPYQATLERLVSAAKIPSARQPQARRLLLREQIGDQILYCGWLLRLPPTGNWIQQVQRLHLLWPLAWLIGSMLIQQGLLLLTWWLVSDMATRGLFNWGWLWAWAILMLSTLFFQFVGSRAQQQLSLRATPYLKQRLLYGILRLDTQELRHEGMGQFLHRIMEAEAVESFALYESFGILMSCVQFILSLLLLNIGLGGWRLPVLLLIWSSLVLVGSWLYLRRTNEREQLYLKMTNAQIERMVGHRTRLAQEEPNHWHADEDQILDAYGYASTNMDRIRLFVQTFAARGWRVVSLGMLFMLLVCSEGRCAALGQNFPVLQPFLLLIDDKTSILSPSFTSNLFISIRALLLAQQALSGLINGMEGFVNLVIAAKQVRPLVDAANRSEPAPAVLLLTDDERVAAAKNRSPFLLAQELNFRYRSEGRPNVQGATLSIYPNDRLLLEGLSGGGKSSLAALLSGVRQPNSGLLLLHGFDYSTVGGNQWRRRIVSVPQFHENHIFNESMAFNLLMGSRWPPQPEDLQAAEEICQELGLGELLAQMPAGMQQMLGESGWRLSHGERSRIYLARALLQPADLILCDESFAALDPQTMRMALTCVLRRAPALLVIAHP